MERKLKKQITLKESDVAIVACALEAAMKKGDVLAALVLNTLIEWPAE